MRGTCAMWLAAALTAGGLLTHAEAQARPRPVRRPTMVNAPVSPVTNAPPALPVASAPAPTTQPENPAASAESAASFVGWIDLSGPLHDGPPQLAWLAEVGRSRTLPGLVDRLDYVARSREHAGVVIHLDQVELDLAQVNELSAAVKRARAAGKRVLFFAEQYDLRSYLLACSGDAVLLQRKGLLELPGLGVEEMYLAGLFEKLGVKADFIQVGRYKGADEAMTRKGPSPEWSQNYDALLDDLYAQVIDQIIATRSAVIAHRLGRTPSETEMRQIIHAALVDSWSMNDEQYVQRGLIDEIVDPDLVDVTAEEFGDDFNWDEDLGAPAPVMAMGNPLAMLGSLLQAKRTDVTRPTIAVIHAQGAITSGDSSSGGMFNEQTIGSRTIADALAEAKDDPMIKGVILRIDSPGGSAIASEIIWQAVRQTMQSTDPEVPGKPVYVSIGSMAASGGYYIASAANEIYASPGSIVGSIGVVGGKIVMGGLYEKLGINVYRRSRGPMGDMFNSVSAFTPEQRAALMGAFNRTYQLFLDRVKEGRGSRVPEDLSALAQGRIFTGQQAVSSGMVDHIGGLNAAIADLAVELKLAPGEYQLLDLPHPMTLPQYLEEKFGIGAEASVPVSTEQSAMLALARQLLGPATWARARSVLTGMSLLTREPVLTIMPSVIVIR